METLKAVVNGDKINPENNKSLIMTLVLFMTRHFPFQTLETMKENITSLLITIQEGLSLINTNDELYKKEISGLKRKISFNLKVIDKIRDRETMIATVYNFLLSLDNLSTLHGFGMSNRFADKININPEKRSIYSLI